MNMTIVNPYIKPIFNPFPLAMLIPLEVSPEPKAPVYIRNPIVTAS